MTTIPLIGLAGVLAHTAFGDLLPNIADAHEAPRETEPGGTQWRDPMTDETEKCEAIHVATLIRLNVTANALELACYDMGEIIINAEPGDERESYVKTLGLMRSALAIARGVRTDVPAPLRERSTWRLMHHPDRLTHFLSIPAA